MLYKVAHGPRLRAQGLKKEKIIGLMPCAVSQQFQPSTLDLIPSIYSDQQPDSIDIGTVLLYQILI
jgi:hypothetical protein